MPRQALIFILLALALLGGVGMWFATHRPAPDVRHNNPVHKAALTINIHDLRSVRTNQTLQSAVAMLKTAATENSTNDTAAAELAAALQQYSEWEEDRRLKLVEMIAEMTRSRLPATEAIAALEGLFSAEPSEAVKKDILGYIGYVGGSAALESLLRTMQTELPDSLLETAKESLTSVIGEAANETDDHSLELLLLSLNADLPDDVRLAAIEAIAERKDERAIPYLETLLEDPNEDIRDAATDAIEALMTP